MNSATLNPDTLHSNCCGTAPLTARLEPWMIEAVSSSANQRLQSAVREFGSPINLLNSEPMLRNIDELNAVADARQVPFRVFFARKANKCLTFVDAAAEAGAGIDVASEEELRQVVERGVAGDSIICTAAIKTQSLLAACIQHNVTIAIDNDDELATVAQLVEACSIPAVSLAIRVSGFRHDGQKLFSRFGFDFDDVLPLINSRWPAALDDVARVTGLHFHLDGYCANQRISAIQQSLRLVPKLRQLGHEVQFLDIGGGIPMSYLDDEQQWLAFWEQLEHSLREPQTEPITFRRHGLGLQSIDGQLRGKPNVYPFYQSPTRADWFAKILDAPCDDQFSIAAAIRQQHLELRCEPGRSILDGCGMTVARVEFCKQHHSGDWFIGLAMNRTQCRTSSDDFLVDPIVLRNSEPSTEDPETSIEGYLVGAYCTESELLSLRKLKFPNGIGVGDLVVFPNTAGYLMHFLESRSHQFPLAMNLVALSGEVPRFYVDAIDRSE
ncbi:Lysine/ornithine decarboxylase [Fuerstiella marisgermanici]|uniref:Lysine/ornithine decarboxylase n=2 Tax=Fuerstiella marisgermanici TaxID=1891926 RepID=A0A1P8WR76_9PLAN|nr:Lysine/ornithine decarboxylase [Fuerstiella marisgermanici]